MEIFRIWKINNLVNVAGRGRNLNLKENFTISLFYFSGHWEQSGSGGRGAGSEGWGAGSGRWGAGSGGWGA